MASQTQMWCHDIPRSVACQITDGGQAAQLVGGGADSRDAVSGPSGAVPPVQLRGMGDGRCPGESCEQARPRRVQDLWAAMAIPFPVSVGPWYDLPQIIPHRIGPDAALSRGGTVDKLARGQPSGQAGEEEGRPPGGRIETNKEESRST